MLDCIISMQPRASTKVKNEEEEEEEEEDKEEESTSEVFFIFGIFLSLFLFMKVQLWGRCF